jgi:hypothetical protein
MSDGQFSSKPMWSGKRTDITATASSGADSYSTADAGDFARSPSVRRETDALREEPYLDFARLDCTPFPRATPEAARDLGEPVASAVLVQEYLIGLIFLRFWGWIFIVFGVLIVIGGVSMLAVALLEAPEQRGDSLAGAGVVALVGLAIAGAGAWFGIFRGRVVNERCWFCPHGMVWMTERVFEWFPWEDIPEVYAKAHANRPAVGIRFDGPISWISFSDSERSRLIVQYIENRASAAWLTAALELLAEGKVIHLGGWDLHRLSLHGPDESIQWTQVADVRARRAELVFEGADGRAHLTIWLDEVPLPSLFAALARALVAHARELR